MKLTVIDYVIAAMLAAGLVIGCLRGFVRQLLSVAGWFIGYIAAFLFYDDLAPWIAKLPPFSSLETNVPVGDALAAMGAGDYVFRAVAFAVLFFGCKLLLSGVGMMLHGIASLPGLRTLNRAGGAVLALVEAALIALIALLVLEALPYDRARLWAADSVLYGWVKAHSPLILEKL